MNEFEVFLQENLEFLKEKRRQEDKEILPENELFKLILMEITYGELFIITRDFPNVDISKIIKKCIYVEARCKKYSPENALLETKKQMENRI